MKSGGSSLEEQFQQILDEYGPALRRLAAGYERLPKDRDDLLQEIALALWLALPRFRGESSLKTFVFRIAHNRSLTHLWRARRASSGNLEGVEVVDPDPGPETRAASRQRSERLQAALRSLSIHHRQVLILALEELTHKEMAEVLGVSENAVAVRLSRARKELRRSLGEEE